MRRNPAGLNSAVRRPGERKIRSVRLANSDYDRACERATSLGRNFSFHVECLILGDLNEANRYASPLEGAVPPATDLATLDAQKVERSA